MTFRIPLRAATSQNARFLNPFARAAIVKRERRATEAAFILARAPRLTSDTRFLVKMVRIGPNELDDDNLAGSLKAVRDQLAAQLGVDDRDRRVRFTYDQRSEGYVTTKDRKTGRTKKLGIFAVEVLIRQQRCADCFVEHCDCIHGELCADCAEAFGA